MGIKNLFMFLLLAGLTTTTHATGGSCEQGFAENPLMGPWKLSKITKDPDPNSSDRLPYPESIVIHPTYIKIKLPAHSAPITYGLAEHGSLWQKRTQVYDKVPDQAPYTLLTESVTYFKGRKLTGKGDSIFIELKWIRKDTDGNVRYVIPGSYAFELNGKKLLFTRTNDIDNPKEGRTQTVYQATYTRQ